MINIIKKEDKCEVQEDVDLVDSIWGTEVKI